MALENFVKNINNLLEKARQPLEPISGILLLCSVFKRPGMSSMVASANAIKRQSEFGAPTGKLPDGTDNMMNSLIYVSIDETLRELRNNGKVEVVIPPGSIVIKGFGANAGGPVVFEGTNIINATGTGIIR